MDAGCVVMRFDQTASPARVRAAISAGEYAGYTAGICRGYVQANLCILPKAWADDFLLYCQRNPAACPLLAVPPLCITHAPSCMLITDLRNAALAAC